MSIPIELIAMDMWPLAAVTVAIIIVISVFVSWLRSAKSNSTKRSRVDIDDYETLQRELMNGVRSIDSVSEHVRSLYSGIQGAQTLHSEVENCISRYSEESIEEAPIRDALINDLEVLLESETRTRWQMAVAKDQEIKRLETINDSMQLAFSNSLDKALSEIATQQSAFEEVVVEKEAELSIRLELQQQEVLKLKEQLIEENSQDKVSKLSKELNAMNGLITALQLEIEMQNQDLKLLRAKDSEQSTALNVIQEDLRASTSAITALELEISAGNENLTVLQEQNSEQVSSIALLQSELDAANVTIIALQLNVESGSQNLTLLAEKDLEHDSSLAVLQSELDAANCSISSLQLTISSREQELSNLESLLQNSKKELDDSILSNESLRADLDSQRTICSQLVQEQSTSSANLLDLLTDFGKSKQTSALLEQELAQVTGLLEESNFNICKLEAELQAKENQISILGDCIAQMKLAHSEELSLNAETVTREVTKVMGLQSRLFEESKSLSKERAALQERELEIQSLKDQITRESQRQLQLESSQFDAIFLSNTELELARQELCLAKAASAAIVEELQIAKDDYESRLSNERGLAEQAATQSIALIQHDRDELLRKLAIFETKNEEKAALTEEIQSYCELVEKQANEIARLSFNVEELKASIIFKNAEFDNERSLLLQDFDKRVMASEDLQEKNYLKLSENFEQKLEFLSESKDMEIRSIKAQMALESSDLFASKFADALAEKEVEFSKILAEIDSKTQDASALNAMIEDKDRLLNEQEAAFESTLCESLAAVSKSKDSEFATERAVWKKDTQDLINSYDVNIASLNAEIESMRDEFTAGLQIADDTIRNLKTELNKEFELKNELKSQLAHIQLKADGASVLLDRLHSSKAALRVSHDQLYDLRVITQEQQETVREMREEYCAMYRSLECLQSELDRSLLSRDDTSLLTEKLNYFQDQFEDTIGKLTLELNPESPPPSFNECSYIVDPTRQLKTVAISFTEDDLRQAVQNAEAKLETSFQELLDNERQQGERRLLASIEEIRLSKDSLEQNYNSRLDAQAERMQQSIQEMVAFERKESDLRLESAVSTIQSTSKRQIEFAVQDTIERERDLAAARLKLALANCDSEHERRIEELHAEWRLKMDIQRAQLEEFLAAQPAVIPKANKQTSTDEPAAKIEDTLSVGSGRSSVKSAKSVRTSGSSVASGGSKTKSRSSKGRLGTRRSSLTTYWKFADFHLREELGKGRLGPVVHAVEFRTAKEFAIKKISRRRMDKLGASDEILRQIELQGQLRHPNLLSMLGSFEDDRWVYLVLEYMPNAVTLADHQQQLLNQKLLFPSSDVSSLVGALASALEYVHEQNLVHGQVRLSSVLINSSGVPRLTDFGSTHVGMPVVAPEMTGIIPGSRALDFKLTSSVDVWALGALAYSLLVGRYPFMNNDKSIDNEQVLSSDPVFPAFVDKCAQDLITKMLAKNPADRPTMSQVRNHAFFQKQPSTSVGVMTPIEEEGDAVSPYPSSATM